MNGNHSSFFILTGYVLVCLIGYFSMTDQPSLVSSLFSCTFAWIFAFTFISLKTEINHRHYKPVLFCIILSFANVFLLSINDGFDYYKKFIMFSCFMLLAYILSNIREISKKVLWCIFIINVIFSLSYLYVFNQGFSLFEGEYLLTLGFSNPNLAGMFLLNSFLYIALFVTHIYSSNTVKSKLLCLPFVALAVALMFLINLTKCRSSIVSVAGFLLLVVWDILHKGNVKFPKWTVLLWALFPIVFVFLYTNYIETSGIDITLSFDDSSKSNASRNIVWLPALQSLSENWLLGDYYGISEGTGMSQMHNTHLDVWCSYGIVPFLLFLVFLYRIAFDSLYNTKTTLNRYALYAFVVCFISGTFEAALVAGGAGLYILSCGFLLLANTSVTSSYDINENSTS